MTKHFLQKNKRLNRFGTLLMLFVGLLFLVNQGRKRSQSVRTIDVTESTACPEELFEGESSVNIQRYWKDYARNEFCHSYAVSHNANDQSNYFRNVGNPYFNSRNSTYEAVWGNLYSRLIEYDTPVIKAFTDSLLLYAQEFKPSRAELANMVVTMVQDIPYMYILDIESCDSGHDDFECIDDQKFGVLTPVEFLYSLQGDCDTRSMLLYGILRELGFEPKIAISKAYRHAMLLLDVVTSGDYLMDNGQKYYFWETTARGWKPGAISPEMSNTKNWHIALH